MSAFNDYYQEIHGARWGTLRSSLLNPAPKISRPCFDQHAHYTLDSASIRAALALGVSAGDQVLDLCAAPGGKALVLLEELKGKGKLVANELSLSRRMRLKDVLETHVPSALHSLFQITGFDGNQFGLKRPESFDKVLLDAPCSSEQHLLSDDPEQLDWKVSRTKQLSQRQYSLLCSALLTVKQGGDIIYSTCSISPLENDGVVGRILERKGDQVELSPETECISDLEKTEFGYQIFPDRFAGAGPIYISKLRRK